MKNAVTARYLAKESGYSYSQIKRWAVALFGGPCAHSGKPRMFTPRESWTIITIGHMVVYWRMPIQKAKQYLKEMGKGL